MADQKYCPLSYAVGKGAYDQEVANFDYCKKVNCAWWFASEEKCSRLVAAESLHQIANHSKFQ